MGYFPRIDTTSLANGRLDSTISQLTGRLNHWRLTSLTRLYEKCFLAKQHTPAAQRSTRHTYGMGVRVAFTAPLPSSITARRKS